METKDFPLIYSFGDDARENRRIKAEIMIAVEAAVFLGSKSVVIKTIPAHGDERARVELDIFDVKRPRYNYM